MGNLTNMLSEKKKKEKKARQAATGCIFMLNLNIAIKKVIVETPANRIGTSTSYNHKCFRNIAFDMLKSVAATQLQTRFPFKFPRHVAHIANAFF